MTHSPPCEPNPPVWPASVLIFSPDDSDAADRIAAATGHLQTQAGHFSDDRVALLFKPGTYALDVLVGYYVQVMGLGASPADTVFTGERGVYCPAMDPGRAGSLDTFWRTAENFTSSAPQMMWAVSQSAPLRRVHVQGDLLLHCQGEYASGGFMASVQVDGRTEMGSQQQWVSRNCAFAVPPSGGAWSIMYLGCQGVVDYSDRSADCDLEVSALPVTPVIAEKPFLTCDNDALFTLQVPHVAYNSVGIEHTLTPVSFSSVFVARTEDTTAAIQAKLDAGLHVLFTPGIYKLQTALHVTHSGTVLLGIGLATLVAPKNGAPCLHIASDLKDVRVAGLMLQASTGAGDCLLRWGDEAPPCRPTDHVAGIMSDLFCRVGGPDLDRTGTAVHTMVIVHQHGVVGDNIWNWTADHSVLKQGEVAEPGERYHLVRGSEFQCCTGLRVLGNHVTMIGLAVEHTLEDLVQWKGEHGMTIMYQAELPYHVGPQYAEHGYVGYRVYPSVQHHTAHGLGVYCFHRDHEVLVPTAMCMPEGSGIVCSNLYTRFLNGKGGIHTVMNGSKGGVVSAASRRKLAYC